MNLYYEFSAASFQANLFREHDHRLVVFAPSKVSWLDEHTLAVRRSGFEFALAHFLWVILWNNWPLFLYNTEGCYRKGSTSPSLDFEMNLFIFFLCRSL